MRVLTGRVMIVDDAFRPAMLDASRAMNGDFVGSELIFSTVEPLAKLCLPMTAGRSSK
ncbi:hypothetical protein SAMN05216516_10545 [Izhakiella capsodis]|uniref:Uncharacterized protein n=1 Tax=Izhakiella capsodis TaxID=1367852 RepID=A0A1I4XY25_9GAMM|nr:hypothetical protein SAMN05216516_10545 [Izhakiella capsodis]